MRRNAAFALAVAVFAAGCRDQRTAAEKRSAADKIEPRVVRLYFEAPTLLLTPEQRSLQLPQSAAGALPIVVNELAKGPANAVLQRTLPPDVVVRGTFLLPDGTAFVDLGGPTLSGGWPAGSHQELIAVYSIVQTVMANFPEVRRVRLLLNGTPADTLAGHINLGRPFRPDATMVEAGK